MPPDVSLRACARAGCALTARVMVGAWVELATLGAVGRAACGGGQALATARVVVVRQYIHPSHTFLPPLFSHNTQHGSAVTLSTDMPAISFLPFLQTVPWGTRILTALLVVSSLLQYSLAAVVRRNSAVDPSYGHELPWLVLIPKTSWKFPWTLLTSGFVELNIIEVSIRMPVAYNSV